MLSEVGDELGDVTGGVLDGVVGVVGVLLVVQEDPKSVTKLVMGTPIVSVTETV